MISALKSDKGLSLMEILVAGLMFAILASTVIMVISPMMLAYSRANSLAEYNTILDSVGNTIISQLSGAVSEDSIDFDNSGDGSLVFTSALEEITFSVNDDGHLLRNGNLVFPGEFYGGKQISFEVFEVNVNQSPAFQVEVTIFPSGGPGGATAEIYRTYTVLPLMLG
ncbi:MAG: hypothetical protein FWC13_08930 [Oscillospiraceae bacterium]|nr:hypothetical protein [Oscillospiraceae bacterium]